MAATAAPIMYQKNWRTKFNDYVTAHPGLQGRLEFKYEPSDNLARGLWICRLEDRADLRHIFAYANKKEVAKELVCQKYLDLQQETPMALHQIESTGKRLHQQQPQQSQSNNQENKEHKATAPIPENKQGTKNKKNVRSVLNELMQSCGLVNPKFWADGSGVVVGPHGCMYALYDRVPAILQQQVFADADEAAQYVIDHFADLFDERWVAPCTKDSAWKQFVTGLESKKIQLTCVTTASAANKWVQDYVDNNPKLTIVGVDVEAQHGKQLCCIQIATASNVLVFVSQHEVSAGIAKLLANEQIVKAVVDGSNDLLWLFSAGYRQTENMFDVAEWSEHYGVSPKAGLERYVKWFLGMHLDDMPYEFAHANWTSASNMSLQQKQYAACDAWLALQLATSNYFLPATKFAKTLRIS